MLRIIIFLNLENLIHRNTRSFFLVIRHREHIYIGKGKRDNLLLFSRIVLQYIYIYIFILYKRTKVRRLTLISK